MAYIGKTPTIGNFQKCDAITVVNGQAAYTMQVGGTNVSPESENHMLVSLNGIIQAPVDSFTVSGSTITFASNLATGDVIDFIMLLGNVLDLGTPSDNTVTAAKLNNDIISSQTALTAEPADTDEFLVSDAGTLKRIDYSLIKGSGSWEKLITTTISSGDASVIFNNTYITNSHLDYKIVYSAVRVGTDDQAPRLMYSTDNGSTYLSSYKNARRGYGAGGQVLSSSQTDSGGSYLLSNGLGSASGETLNGFSIIYDPLKQSTTASYTHVRSSTVFTAEDGNLIASYSANRNAVTTAVDAIKFENQSGTLTSGKITLYGRKV